MSIEKTLILIKPDGMQRRLSGLSIDRLDNTGLELVGAKVVAVSDKLARTHYALLEGKGFFADKAKFDQLVGYIKGDFHGVTRGRVLALVYQGENAVKVVRDIVGATHPEAAAPGTIRGSFGRINSKTGIFENVIHASGNSEEAEREVGIWFKPEELA